MIVAVVTPTTGDEEKLKRCMASVAAQKLPEGVEVMHVLVGDGAKNRDWISAVSTQDGWLQNAFNLPARANDAGATPRAIGSVYAMGQGAEVIAFLDDDCWFHEDHTRIALECINNGANVVVANRELVHGDTLELIMIDTSDSNGDTHVDTNCLVLGRDATKFAANWGWALGESGADRPFWERIRNTFEGDIARHNRVTVYYPTLWLSHFPPWHSPPKRAKVPVMGPDGTRQVDWVRPIAAFIQTPDGLKTIRRENGQEIVEPAEIAQGTECVRLPNGVVWTVELEGGEE